MSREFPEWGFTFIFVVASIFAFATLVWAISSSEHNIEGTVDATDCSQGWFNHPVIVLSGAPYDSEKGICVFASAHIGGRVIALIVGRTIERMRLA